VGKALSHRDRSASGRRALQIFAGTNLERAGRFLWRADFYSLRRCLEMSRSKRSNRSRWIRRSWVSAFPESIIRLI
jgi:hypothetical protein